MMASELPAGYTLLENSVHIRDERGEPLKRWQPVREWSPGQTEALYWSNRLNTVSFASREAAVRFIWRHAGYGCDEHLALFCFVCPSMAHTNAVQHRTVVAQMLDSFEDHIVPQGWFGTPANGVPWER